MFYADINLAEAEQSASAWPSARAAEMDVTDEARVRAVTEAIVREYGRIDILVNNAGVNTLAHRVPDRSVSARRMGSDRGGRPDRVVPGQQGRRRRHAPAAVGSDH